MGRWSVISIFPPVLMMAAEFTGNNEVINMQTNEVNNVDNCPCHIGLRLTVRWLNINFEVTDSFSPISSTGLVLITLKDEMGYTAVGCLAYLIVHNKAKGQRQNVTDMVGFHYVCSLCFVLFRQTQEKGYFIICLYAWCFWKNTLMCIKTSFCVYGTGTAIMLRRWWFSGVKMNKMYICIHI